MNDVVAVLAILAVAGGLVTKLRLPPLVGYLAAGFLLAGLGVPTPEGLREVGDIGVTLLLFSVGLKLDLRLLARREVGVTALAHMAVTVCSLALLLFVGSLVPFGVLSGVAMPQVLLLAFALSFSSTVLVVKALEEAGRSGSFHGRIAVGILVVQDVVAVVFMVVAEGQLPSWWAILLLALFPARRLLARLVEECHHPEVQMLAGLVLSLGLGYLLFDAVGIKGDLGALVIGVLLRESSAAEELARRLDPLKDLLLVAFFMAIGLSGVPSVDHLLLALGLLLVLPVKGWGFARLLRRAGVDRRVMGRVGLSLANYSEFGLIVAAVAVGHGWLSEDWLVGMAVVVACGFIVSSAVQRSPRVTGGWHRVMPAGPAQEHLHPECAPVHLHQARFLVVGMGRVGTAAAERLEELHPGSVACLDQERRRIEQLCAAGLTVFEGDATDPDLWERTRGTRDLRAVVLALPQTEQSREALQLLRGQGYAGEVVAATRQESDAAALAGAGADVVLGFHRAAGATLAVLADRQLSQDPGEPPGPEHSTAG